MKKQHLIKRLFAVALFIYISLCLFAPSSFATSKEDQIKLAEEIIRNCEKDIATLKEFGDDKSSNGAKIIENCNKLIASFQSKLDELRNGKNQGEKAYKADCGAADPNRTTPVTTDLCPGNLVAMTNFCGGGTGCPYVCCPRGLPYLNHCDCKCYATSDFECHSYSNCKEQPKQ
jgi:hypothetical protein